MLLPAWSRYELAVAAEFRKPGDIRNEGGRHSEQVSSKNYESTIIRSCVSPGAGSITVCIPAAKVHRANMGPIWGRQDPGGSHVGPINLAIWD